MTKEELAGLLNGRQYRDEMTHAEEDQAKMDDLVVVFGASDDLAEFRGAIHDEVGCYEGATLYVTQVNVYEDNHECDCDHCGFEKVKEKASKIEAVWCGETGYSWTYKTSIPHATFDILEDGEKYCRGIVFHRDDLN